MQFQTTYKTQKISAKKMRFILSEVKKLHPLVAVAKLSVSPLKASAILRKAILNSLHNASQSLKVANEVLRFAKINVDDGPFFKRMRPGPKGMANFYKKRTSHITIVYNTTLPKTQKVNSETTSTKQMASSEKKVSALSSEKSKAKTVKKDIKQSKETKKVSKNKTLVK